MPESNELADVIAWDDLPAEPTIVWDAATVTACFKIYHRYVESGRGQLIPDKIFCDLPRWKFFAFLSQRCGVVFGGSPAPNLPCLPPRVVAHNVKGWDTPIIFAFTEYLTPMFHAILRFPEASQSPFSWVTTVVVGRSKGSEARPLRFYYGLDYRAQVQSIWRRGTIYLYNANDLRLRDRTLRYAPAKTKRILPMARATVSPADWPLLDQVQGLNPVTQARRRYVGLDGYPWLNDSEVHPHRSKRSRVELVRQYLDQNFTERVGLFTLGERLGVSPASALRMFRAAYGLSPHEYQVQKRIAQAKQQLKRGQSIARVAAEVGFADQTHLNRHFRRVVGMTPGEYLRLQ